VLRDDNDDVVDGTPVLELARGNATERRVAECPRLV